MDARIRVGLLTGLALFGLCGGVAAQAPDSLPAGVTPAMITVGGKLFGGGGMCVACHGAAGQGGIGADLTDARWDHGDGSYDAIVRTVLEGVSAAKAVKRVPMPPRGGSRLSDEQVRAVAAYVWSFRLRASGR
jgi:mono/diheme cytochrome c family protein